MNPRFAHIRGFVEVPPYKHDPQRRPETANTFSTETARKLLVTGMVEVNTMRTIFSQGEK